MFLRRTALISTVFVVLLFVAGCSSDGKDRGDGFKVTKTEPTTVTQPSKTRTIKQPCSLISLETASKILDVTIEKLGEPESSEADGTLRCRYAATSDDGKLFLVLNIYVYEEQKQYDLIKTANKGSEIQTSFDEGFTYDKTTTYESERYVAARDGKHRVAVSASIAAIEPNTQLTQEQIILPEVQIMAQELGLILYELQ